MRLLGIADVELETLEEARESDAHDRRALKFTRRTEEIERMESFEISFLNFNPDEISNKQVIWCVSNCSPFKQFLHRIGRALDEWCRYCGAATESAGHLLFECDAIGSRMTSRSTMDDLKRSCRELIKRLMAESWRVD